MQSNNGELGARVERESRQEAESTCFETIPIKPKNMSVVAPKRILPVCPADFACPADGGPGHDYCRSISIGTSVSPVT